jgi:hypothetical protein
MRRLIWEEVDTAALGWDVTIANIGSAFGRQTFCKT